MELIDLEWTLDKSKLILYVLNDRGPEATRLGLQAAAAGLGTVEVQPADPVVEFRGEGERAVEVDTAEVRKGRFGRGLWQLKMADDTFTAIEKVREAEGAKAAIEELPHLGRAARIPPVVRRDPSQEEVRDGAPLSRPTSFDNVPEELRRSLRGYVSAARRVGEASRRE